ncbi:MAG: aspartate carbamoyltransferase catalytic subunit [Mariprofundaceae bacterium]|nr:aspartate carbamoyltransferase catalytic subunit [Mariprofundaceae bacterium]
MKPFPQHLLSITDLTRAQINALIDFSQPFLDLSRDDIRKASTMRGKTVINLFFENSTRTRSSFEIAGKRLSADVINISASMSAVQKGETLMDTGQTLAAMRPHVVVVRHGDSGSCHFLAKHTQGTSIVNGGDGAHEHPTQVLTDLLTLKNAWGDVKGKVITIVGDIKHSRVARSHLLAAKIMGYSVRVVAPKTLLPLHIEKMGCDVFHRFEDAIVGSDCIYMLRIQNERLKTNCSFPSIREYHEAYGLNMARFKLASDALILHPGPMNRGVEITSDVANHAQSQVLNQVENGVAMRMAILSTLCGLEAL